MAMSMLLSNTVPSSSTMISSTSSFAAFPPIKIKELGRPGNYNNRTTSIRSSSGAEKRSTSTSSGAEAAGSSSSMLVDRRNVLLGLGGGLYGATTAGNIVESASAAPIQPPELTACHSANYPDGYGDQVPVACCPPYDLSKPIDIRPYEFPANPRLRQRKPAHLLNQMEKDRFKSAIAQMKALPRSHPWNFLQQAQIHCAYCNDAYNQKGTDIPLQVHFSWLFLPWHRYYIYFFEKILGKIIDDDTFALPYWNFSNVDGMKIPDIYLDPSSSLYNRNRNSSHLNDLFNFNYSYDLEDQPPPPDVAQKNIEFLHELFKNTLAVPSLFMGSPVRAGGDVNAGKADLTSGAIENIPHNVAHMWVGTVEAPNTDMGNFFSSGRDMIFYALHSEIDRLWEIYRSKRGHLVEFNDPDWLDATFIFYDENEKVVSVKVRDGLNVNEMGYTFKDTTFNPPTVQPRAAPVPTNPKLISDFGPAPRPLTETIRVSVTRPKPSRTPPEKAAMAEALFIKIKPLDGEPIRFDVFVNKVIESQGSDYTMGQGKYAGSYTRVRHNHLSGGRNAGLQLGIQGCLDNIGADADPKIAVIIVPRSGNVKILGVQIDLLPAQFY